MGWREYGEPEKRSRLGEFVENLIFGFIAFTSCIGGWLVHFGMHPWWVLGLSAVIAGAFAIGMIRR
jgi:hypothetical protein